ncbi:MAG TPA: DNA alkylation repair protein [Blastocatellia bacterium]|jgi:3-methyladenine DNA glycosylase AlkD|nr:DNA alkylation repair protein [Blastocatellia bacterium]
MPNTPSPDQLARQAERELKAAANVRIARQAKFYFKPEEDVWLFGVDTPTQRRIVGDLFRRVRGDWEITEAVEFCDILIKRREMEMKNAGIFLLARYQKSFKKNLLRNVENWLANDHCSNWAATDALCGEVLGPLIRRHPALTSKLKTWTGKRNLWLRRAAAVGIIHSVRRGEQLDDAYVIAESLFKYPEDLIHKAAGWMLREAGKPDPARLESFLLEHGPRIPRTTLRYAIERFPPEKRKTLLEETKERRMDNEPRGQGDKGTKKV